MATGDAYADVIIGATPVTTDGRVTRVRFA
jgi:hypothetical protein